MPNSAPWGSAARTAATRPGPRLEALGDQLAVGGEDLAALDLLRLEQRPLVLGLRLELLGVEDRPVAGEPDEQREEHQDADVEAGDRRVHAITSAGPDCGRRARSEISSSSASRTMLAMTELPP